MHHEFTWLISTVLLTAVLSFITMKFVIKFAFSKQLLDVSSGRKRHKGEIPSFGGITIFIPLFIVLLVVAVISGALIFYVLAISSLLIVALGVYDDIFPLNASKKFLGQILVASVVVLAMHARYGPMISIAFFETPVFTLIGLIIGLVFIMNAYNLIDGINGLAAGLALVACLFFTAWFYQSDFYYHAFVAASVVASLLVFLKFNVIDQKIFLGDNGSMLLGLVIGVLSFEFLILQNHVPHYLSFTSPIALVLALSFIPVYDLTRLFIVRFLLLEKSPFKPDRNHVHHLLVRLGFAQINASMLLVFIALMLIGVALILDDTGNLYTLVVLTLISSAFVMFADILLHYKYRGRIEKKTVFEGVSKFRKKLKKPQIVDFVFGFTIYLLFISVPFFRVSTTIPTILLLLLMAVIVVKSIYDKGRIPLKLKSGWGSFLRHRFTQLLLAFVAVYFVWGIAVSPLPFTYSTVALLVLMFLFWGIMFFQYYAIQISLSEVLSAYVIGCTTFSIYILLAAIQDIPKEGWDALYYVNFLNNVKGNPIVHSLYFNLAIVFIVHTGIHTKTAFRKFFVYTLIALFGCLVILFGSKVGYVVLVISLGYVFTKEVKKQWLRGVLLLGAMAILFATYSLAPAVNTELNEFVYKVTHNESLEVAEKLPRVNIWAQCIALIKEEPILGHGSNASNVALINKYKEIGWDHGVEVGFNAHNQFFETWIQTGLLGLVILIAILAFSFRMAYRNKNTIHILFLIIILVYMCFESLLSSQMGLVGFGLFNAMFLSQYYLKRRKLKKENKLALDKG